LRWGQKKGRACRGDLFHEDNYCYLIVAFTGYLISRKVLKAFLVKFDPERLGITSTRSSLAIFLQCLFHNPWNYCRGICQWDALPMSDTAYEIHEVSDWLVVSDEPMGTKPKYWLQKPNQEHWLFKLKFRAHSDDDWS
jgi:hypothetical protein